MILTKFPQVDGRYFILGPAGKLEVAFHFPKENIQEITTLGLICHPHPLHGGTMENKVVTTVVRAFRQMNIPAVRFNYRGVGQSEGQYDETIGETEDLLSVIHWIELQKPGIQFWLAGFSFGSFIAANAAYEHSVKQLITIAPPVNHYDFDAIKNPHSPWLIIQGDQDEVVPAREVIQWVESNPIDIKLRVLKDATHFFHGRLSDLQNVLVEELS